jgi:hypothetical protein
VRARTTCGTATQRTRLTILPLRITVMPHRLGSGSPLTVMLHTGGKGQVSITLEVDTTRDTDMAVTGTLLRTMHGGRS